AKEEGIADEQIKERLNDAVDRLFAQKAAQYGPEVWRQVEKSVLMQLFDQNWKDHLLHLDHLRQGIGLRAYGQKDPLNEYKREAFNLFSDLLTRLPEGVTNGLATLQLPIQQPPPPAPQGAAGRGAGGHSRQWARCARSTRTRRSPPCRPTIRRSIRPIRPAAASPRCSGRAPTPRSIPTIRRPGARSRATRPAPAA